MHINNQPTYAATYAEYEQLERNQATWPQWAKDLQASLQRGEAIGKAAEPWLYDTYIYLKNQQDAKPVSMSDGFIAPMLGPYFIGHTNRKAC